MMRETKAWGADDVAQLRKLSAGGLSHREIARVMGRSKSSIEKKAPSIGLEHIVRRNLWPAERDAELRRLTALGTPNGMIAEELGVSLQSVQSRKRRLKLTGGPKPPRRPRPSWSVAAKALGADEKPGATPVEWPPAPDDAVALVSASPGACRWPYDGNEPKCCGKRADAGSYCMDHARQAFRLPLGWERKLANLKGDVFAEGVAA